MTRLAHARATYVPVVVALAAAALGTLAAVTAHAAPPAGQAARGLYLVNTSGCHDCHTPWKMGANGPEPDMSRALSGHPESIAITSGAKLPDSIWIAAASAT